MGAHTKILIGVKVSYRDFVEKIEETVSQCSNSHPGENGKFCSQCGLPVKQVIKKVATEKLKKFCQFQDLSVEDFLRYNSLEAVISNYLEMEPVQGIFVACVDCTGENDQPLESFVLGFPTLETRSNDCNVDETASISVPEFTKTLKDAHKFVADCGFDPSKVRIYITKHLTY